MNPEKYPIIIKNDKTRPFAGQNGQPSLAERLRLLARNPLVWAGALVIFIIIIFAILSFKDRPGTTTSCGNNIIIDNFGNYVSDIAPEARDTLFCMLYERVKTELGTEEDIPTSGATFREDSVKKHEDDDGGNYGTALVDIEALHQTWEMIFEWPARSEWQEKPILEAYVSCPAAEQNRFEDFNCNIIHDSLSFTDGLLTVDNSSYRRELENGMEYTIHLHYYPQTGEPYLEANISSCGNADIISDTRASVEEWLNSYDSLEDAPPIYVRDLCDGGI